MQQARLPVDLHGVYYDFANVYVGLIVLSVRSCLVQFVCIFEV